MRPLNTYLHILRHTWQCLHLFLQLKHEPNHYKYQECHAILVVVDL